MAPERYISAPWTHGRDWSDWIYRSNGPHRAHRSNRYRNNRGDWSDRIYWSNWLHRAHWSNRHRNNRSDWRNRLYRDHRNHRGNRIHWGDRSHWNDRVDRTCGGGCYWYSTV